MIRIPSPINEFPVTSLKLFEVADHRKGEKKKVGGGKKMFGLSSGSVQIVRIGEREIVVLERLPFPS